MPVPLEELASIASVYTQEMTSIRGRRVQRLIKREFAGAEHVSIVSSDTGASAVLGVSETGAAFTQTDGRGKSAAVIKWLHGDAQALVAQYDLLKDSMPLLSTDSMPIAELPGKEMVEAAHLRMIRQLSV